MADIRYYPHDYTDEVVPCDCTLEGWADWFSKPDPDWNRPEAAKSGDTFTASVAEIHELECLRGFGQWTWSTEQEAALVAQGAEFYLRVDQGGGWCADNSGGSVAEALAFADYAEIGERHYLAAMVWTGDVELRFDLTYDGPNMVVLSPVGHA